MAKQLQLIYDAVVEKQSELADLKRGIKEALENSKPYKEVTEKLKTIREKRKAIEVEVKQSFNSELGKIDDLTIDLASERDLMADAALSQYASGKTVEVKDKAGNVYTPIFSVKFVPVKE